MIEQLKKAIEIIPHLLSTPEVWQSLIINRRKPHTYRAFLFPEKFSSAPELDGTRICLHRFEPCEEKDAFLHPHPWPSAMLILSGRYRMRIGASETNQIGNKPIIVLDEILSAGCVYSMTEPRGWHAVQPLTTCYSIMINGQPWAPSDVHGDAPTTKGKDLEKMDHEKLLSHLDMFKILLENHKG